MEKVFGKRLKELRLENGLYQKDLAEEFGVSAVTVTHWENGRQEPSIEMLIRIADFFDVTLDYLTGRDNCPSRI